MGKLFLLYIDYSNNRLGDRYRDSHLYKPEIHPPLRLSDIELDNLIKSKGFLNFEVVKYHYPKPIISILSYN